MNGSDNDAVTTPSKGMVSLLFLLVFVLAFAFQGTRGIWEPDEGYYIGIARDMVETGDWVVPQMNLRPISGQASRGLLGKRLCHEALRLQRMGGTPAARSLVCANDTLRGSPREGALGQPDRLFGFTFLRYFTDPACGCQRGDAGHAARLLGYRGPIFLLEGDPSANKPQEGCVEGIPGDFPGVRRLVQRPSHLRVYGSAVPLSLSYKDIQTLLFECELLSLSFLFVTIGASWYVAVIYYIPGASGYFFDNQIYGRLVSDKYARNSDWYAFLYVYLPIVFFGTLPWSVAWYPEAMKRRGLFWGRLRRPIRDADPRVVFLFLATVVPLIVFSCASSRLPLYILPLFTPLSIIGARCWLSWKPRLFSARENTFRLFPLGLWCLLLISVKAGMAYWPTERDTRALWISLQEILPESRFEFVVVNGRRHGLSFYSPEDVEWVTTRDHPYPSFHAQEGLEEEVHELPTSSHSHVFVARDRDYETVANLITGRGYSFEKDDGPFNSQILVCPPAPTEDRAVRLVAMGDTRTGDSGQIQLGSALCQIDEGRPLDGIILLGDNLSYFGEAEHIANHFEKPYAPLLRNGVQFFAVLGNHDVKKGLEPFQLNYPRFNMNGRRYHAQVFGDRLVQCVFLDSTTILTDPRQQSWLEKTLRESTSTWRLVALHHPLYGRTKRRPDPEWEYRDLLEPILIRGKADVVVNGHNHLYMRLKPQNGIQHFTAGSGGELESGVLLEDDPDLVVGYDRTTAALVLQFTESKCEFQAVNVLEEVVDRGVILRDRSESHRAPEQAADRSW